MKPRKRGKLDLRVEVRHIPAPDAADRLRRVFEILWKKRKGGVGDEPKI